MDTKLLIDKQGILHDYGKELRYSHILKMYVFDEPDNQEGNSVETRIFLAVYFIISLVSIKKC